MPENISFEETWRKYINGSESEDEAKLLRSCLHSATTLDEMIQVFNACHNNGYSKSVRPQAIKKMITVIKTIDDASRVYKLAGKKGLGTYQFPSRRREVLAKLEQLQRQTA